MKINVDFNSIKDLIRIPAQMQKHYIKHDAVYVEMSININQFHQWCSDNYPQGCLQIRKLWYDFLDYIHDIFDYGYHFDNILNIDKFIEQNNHPISQLDGIIANLPYNIYDAAEVYKPEIAKDKNSFNFIIIATGSNLNEDLFADITNNIHILNDTCNCNENEDENGDENENEVETKEEEMQRLIKKYKENGVCHARIAHNVIKEAQANQDDITFIKSMELTPRIVKHNQNNNIISLLWVISKNQFINNFSIFRPKNDTIWNKFKNDFQSNYKQYTCINKKGLNDYLISINKQLDHIIEDISDVDISKENNVKFKSIIQIKEV